jgi:hypothetical protein
LNKKIESKCEALTEEKLDKINTQLSHSLCKPLAEETAVSDFRF